MAIDANEFGQKSGIPMMRSNQGNYSLGGVFHPQVKAGSRKNEAYEKNIKHVGSILNGPTAVRRNDDLSGTKILRNLHTPYNNEAQLQLRKFENFIGSPEYFTFDIETLGDAMNHGNFSVSEIAIQGYTMKNGKYETSNKKLTQLIRPHDDVIKEVKDIIGQLKTDKYSFNLLNDWQQRTVVDIMRYSQLSGNGATGAALLKDSDKLVDIKHNSIVHQLFDRSETLVSSRVIQNMNELVRHMENGLNTITTQGVEAEKAIDGYTGFLKTNSQSYFMSFNGDKFDLPALTAWGEQYARKINNPNKSLDYYRLIRTINADPSKLHEELGRNLKTQPFLGGMTTQQEFRRTLGFDMNEAHSATHDIGDQGLGGIINRTYGALNLRVQHAETPMKNGFNYHPAEFSWSNAYLRSGQKLFSTGGVQAYKDGESSFQARLQKNGKYEILNNSFNNTVINSKSFYEVAGLYDLSDPETNRVGLRLFDAANDSYSFIVREGENAMDQIGSFVQSRFYNWEGVSDDMKEQISTYKTKDLARRRYERMFSLEKAGTGRTGGFESARRMYGNASILQKRIDGVSKNVEAESTKLTAEELKGTKHKPGSKVWNETKNKHANALLAERITHKEMLDQMDFNSQYNPSSKEDKSVKPWSHNPREQKEFFAMKDRLLSELPVYSQAIDYFSKQYDPKIAEAERNKDFKKAGEIKKERDLAWYKYNQTLQKYTGGPFKEKVDIFEFENRRLHFIDYKNNESSHTINLDTMETAEDSIKRYVYSKNVSNRDLPKSAKENLYRERLNRMVKQMSQQGVIDSDMDELFRETNAETNRVSNTITMIANRMYEHKFAFETSREQTSLSQNKALELVTSDFNKTFMEGAVKEVGSMVSVKFLANQPLGESLVLNPELQGKLGALDRTRLSGLNANNDLALEKVFKSLHSSKNFMNNYSYALSFDDESSTAKISIYANENSTSVLEHLEQGKSHGKAVDITVPLIGENGTHVIGNRVLNARQFAFMDGKNVVLQSSAEMLANNYANSIDDILGFMNKGDFENANKKAKRVLNKSVEELSGIQRNLTFNDGFEWNRNQSDFNKQSMVDINSAMIHDWFYNQTNKDGKPRITKEDFYSNDVFDSDGLLKKDVTIDHLKPKKAYELALSQLDWAKQHNLGLSSSSVKQDHAANLILSTQDARDYLPYGHYTFMGRDNPVQFQNAHILDAKTSENLAKVASQSRAYLKFKDLVTTDAQLAYDAEHREKNLNRGVNLKVALMNDQQLTDRLETMKLDPEHKKLMLEEGIIDESGNWNALKKPRIYEQQGLLADDIKGELKVTEQKILTGSDKIRFAEGFHDKKSINPGDLIGWENVEGVEKPIRWENKNPAQLFMQNGRLAASWQEDVFKVIAEGEKATDIGISRKMLAAIVGDESVSLILNPNIKKHKDFGMLISGKAKIYADHMQNIFEDLQEVEGKVHPNDKASILARERDKLTTQWQKGSSMAKHLGLEWDAEKGTFIQRNNLNIPTSRLDRIFNALGIQDKSQVEIGGKKENIELLIQEVRASKVSNYSKMVDETGQRVLSVGHDKDGNLTKTYASGRDGVNWGHREMGVLKNLGLGKTADALFGEMVTQASDPEIYKGVNRLQESKNMIAAFTSFSDPQHAMVDQHKTVGLHNFRNLPELEGDEYTFKKTIFDKNYVTELLGEQGFDTPTHGYWLELPGTNANGKDIYPTVNGADGKSPVNKIFVPFTNLEGADGNIHMRNLQKHIADIYKRADEVSRAKPEQRLAAHEKLQRSVNDYSTQLTKDISSSKGQTGEAVLKASMKQSGSGLFKLLDPTTSASLDGEFTFVSSEDAKAMGVYDKLMDIDAKRVAGETVEDLMVMNVRYPTFHNGAMQVAKLRIGENVKSGEFHTTSLMSDAMRADSDGDYDHIVVMDDEDIQKEWRQAYDKDRSNLDEQYKAHQEEAIKADREYTGKYVTDGDSHFKPFPANTQDELAAKVGKRVIGMSSNLNLSMRQMAGEFLEHGSTGKEAIELFGEGMEQKLGISSKHGQLIAEGRAPGIEMIEAVYRNDRQAAIRIDDEFFGNMFTDKYGMNEAFDAMAEVQDNLKNGLYNKSLRFGTSRGIDVEKIGQKNAVDMIHGSSKNMDVTLNNSFLNMVHKVLNVEQEKTYTDPEGNVHKKVTPYTSVEEQAREPRGKGFAAAAGEYANDLSGGANEGFGKALQRGLENIAKDPVTKWGMIGGALALGGLAGYNILSHDEPLAPPQEGANEYTPRAPQSALPPLGSANQTQSADISVSASGGSISQSQAAMMVNQGIQSSGMNSPKTNVTMDYRDNTAKLNRYWYRDKVEEHS